MSLKMQIWPLDIISTPITRYEADELVLGNAHGIKMHYFSPRIHTWEDIRDWMVNDNNEELTSEAQKDLIHLLTTIPAKGILMCSRYRRNRCLCETCRARDFDTIYCEVYEEYVDDTLAEEKPE